MFGSVRLRLLVTAPLLAACQPGENSPFPGADEVAGSAAGGFVSRTVELQTGEGAQRVEYGTLTVPEDHGSPAGKLIRLPVVRTHPDADSSQPPLFVLGNGPGRSNIRPHAPAWARGGRDVVLVGYRGVDGSVSLDAPGVGPALTTGELPLSEQSLERLGHAFQADHGRLVADGIDLDRYTMIDVIADVEAARTALGYGTIDLYSEGYGTRLAYLYGLRHPGRIRRSLMVGAAAPGRLVPEPEAVDEVIAAYAEIWEQDEEASAKVPNLERLLRRVLRNLPRTWMFFSVDPDKVRLMTFLMLRETRTAAQAFDAFAEAREGSQDRAGLALMCLRFDRLIGDSVNWGDSMAKTASTDYDPTRDYPSEMLSRRALIGSPFAQMLGMMRHGGWPMERLPEEYRGLRPSDVETLMVNGNLDAAAPARFARDELLPMLSNGHLVVLADMAGPSDVVSLQPQAFAHLANAFLVDGEVDDSRFVHERIDFGGQPSLVDEAHRLSRLVLLAGGVAVSLMFLGHWLYVRRRPQSIQRAAAARRSATSEVGS